MIENQPQGLVLSCDLQGLILQVLRNDFGLAGAAPGQLFIRLVESASRAKAMNFLTEVKAQGALLDWEMNVPSESGAITMHFTAGQVGNSLLITAGANGQLAARLYEDMLRINNEQIKMVCAALKDNAGPDHNQYDEISRLNNELVSMQRELAGKNAELAQRIEERTRELREAQEQLVRQEKLAVLGQMAGSVGHELRNPLAFITSAVYYLKMSQPDLNDEIRKYLDMIENKTHTADKIITDLLGFARVNSVVEREAIPVSDLVKQTLERFPAPESVAVTLDIPADLPQIFVDPRQMEQVLGNLVVNACQAMPGGGELVISGQCSVISENTFVAISVRDTGVGIPPENMKKLFEPLFTTKAKGIGLGLAVSQKLAEANGGRIEVQSEAGAGSTFTLWLPVNEGKR